MLIKVREINYKEVNIPDNSTKEDIVKMIQDCEFVVSDTTESEYSCQNFNEKIQEFEREWNDLF